jgi:hypothetical protein
MVAFSEKCQKNLRYTHLFYRSSRFNSGPSTQSIYAIWNNDSASVEQSIILPQLAAVGLSNSNANPQTQNTIQQPIVVAKELVPGSLSTRYSFQKVSLDGVELVAELTIPQHQTLVSVLTSEDHLVCMVDDSRLKKNFLIENMLNGWAKQSLAGIVAPDVFGAKLFADAQGGFVIACFNQSGQISTCVRLSRSN